MTVADRANNAVLQEHDGRWTVQGDPTEGALIVAARKAGLEAEALDARFERVGEVPFSSERKLMTTIHTDAEQQERLLVFTKGAPDVLLGALRAGTGRRRKAALDRRNAARDSENNEAARRRGAAHAGRRLPRTARGCARDDEVDEQRRAGTVFPA